MTKTNIFNLENDNKHKNTFVLAKYLKFANNVNKKTLFKTESIKINAFESVIIRNYNKSEMI